MHSRYEVPTKLLEEDSASVQWNLYTQCPETEALACLPVQQQVCAMRQNRKVDVRSSFDTNNICLVHKSFSDLQAMQTLSTVSNIDKMNLYFTEKYVLENESVLLRPLELSDKELLIEYAVNEPEIWRFNSNGGNGKENFEKYFSTALKQLKDEKEYPFIVFDKKNNKHIGSTRFYEISNEFKRLDIGYTWYRKESQGTGINKHCKYLLLEFAFDRLQMLRVGFGANSKNERSINAMKSIGCIVEGILRQYGRDADGNIIDAIKLSILKNEWDESVKIKLKKQIEKLPAV